MSLGSTGLRILSIGAFPFPYPQGSQVFARAQALALVTAGADVAVATYGVGEGAIPAGIRWISSSSSLAPRTGRSGPSLRKPVADAALVASVIRAQRAERFDVALAHNAEAALVAAAARAITGLRFVYVAHTLMGVELSAYGTPRLRGVLDAVGRAVDRCAASSANAVIALSAPGKHVLSAHTGDEIALISPGLERTDPPTDAEIREACRFAGVETHRFVLYAGNLDSYQDLELLDNASGSLDARFGPVVVATHDATGGERFPNLRIVEFKDFGQVRALGFAASALVATRRRTGGFPIKLLNYMEAARPIIAFRSVAEGLVDGVSARLLDDSAGPGELADAIRELAEAPEFAHRLGTAAHEHLIANHDWNDITKQTLGVALRAIGRST